MSSPYIDDTQTIIAVMGTTGVGKSTFINYATQGGARVGQNLVSCTDECTAYQIPDWDIWLIDTPGFDDTVHSDAKILEKINDCLSEYFHKKARVTGVIYVHAITEPRMRGSAMKNLRMFRQVVGDSNMKHCCLVTTKWSKQQVELSEERVTELRTNKDFWKPLMDRGARIMQFQDSVYSAMDIIRPYTQCRPITMKLVHEYNVQGKNLDQTDAGKEVFDDIEAARKEHAEEMETLKREWAEASAEKDEDMKRMIERERSALDKKIKDMEESQQILHKKLADEKKELTDRIERDRMIRERNKASRKKSIYSWGARIGAGGVGVAATVLTGGLALPGAILLMGAVEAAIDD